MTLWFRGAVSAAVIVLAGSSQALAFSEDLCLERGRLVNCLDSDACEAGQSDGGACYANLVFDLLVSSAHLSHARSMVHTDATHFLAQAVGLTPDVAYWIAAYNEATDLGIYTPFDALGAIVDQPRYTTSLINGWQRTSPITGGRTYHYVVPFNPDRDAPYLADCGSSDPDAICGYRPADGVREGGGLEYDPRETVLIHMQRWAFSDGLACTDGFVDPADPGHCYQEEESRLFPSIEAPVCEYPTFIQGTLRFVGIPMPFGAISGEQIASYAMDDADCFTEVVYEGEMQELLATSSGALIAGEPLPEIIARAGIYLHALQDRISHYQCGDRSFATGPDASGVYFVDYDTYSEGNCSQAAHADGHYREIGLKPDQAELPAQTAAALRSTYEELTRWANEIGAERGWTVSGGPRLDADQAVADLLGVLKVNDPCQRLKAMITLNNARSFDQMPGNNLAAAQIARMCPGPARHSLLSLPL